MEISSLECYLSQSKRVYRKLSIKTLSGITGFRTTKDLPLLHPVFVKILLENPDTDRENVCKSPGPKKRGRLERNSQQAEYNQQDRSRKAGKGTDDQRYPVIPDIRFSRILHEMKEIHDE